MLMVVVKLQQMASSYRFTQEMTISHWLHGWRCPRPPHIQSLPGSGRRGHKSPSPVLPMSPKAQVPHPSSPINSMNLPGVNSIVDKGTHTPLIFTFYRRLLPSLSPSVWTVIKKYHQIVLGRNRGDNPPSYISSKGKYFYLMVFEFEQKQEGSITL